MSAVLELSGYPKPVHHAVIERDHKGRPHCIAISPRSDGDRGSYRMTIRGDGDTYPTVFHTIPKYGVTWVRDAAEEQVVNELHAAILADRGFDSRNNRAPRKTYHALRCFSKRIINMLLKELYSEIPPDLLRVIRRYPASYAYCRSKLYARLSADGPRAWQLADTFPVLAALIYASDGDHAEARELVKGGARLRDVAELESIPLEFRRIKPAVLRNLSYRYEFLKDHPELLRHHCPATVPRQRAWLQAIGQTHHDPDYAVWVAKNFDHIGHFRMVPAIVSDVYDWVQDSSKGRAIDGIEPETVQRLVTRMEMTGYDNSSLGLQNWYTECRRAKAEARPFDARMAPQTALRLSREWHDRQAEKIAAEVAFPDPWYDGAEIGGYSISPIATAKELSYYGHALHNCASSYARRIANGKCYLYAVNENDKPIAMLEIARGMTGPRLLQLKGPCNQAVPKPIARAVNTWMRRQRKARGNGRIPADPGMLISNGLDDIPFAIGGFLPYALTALLSELVRFVA